MNRDLSINSVVKMQNNGATRTGDGLVRFVVRKIRTILCSATEFDKANWISGVQRSYPNVAPVSHGPAAVTIREIMYLLLIA